MTNLWNKHYNLLLLFLLLVLFVIPLTNSLSCSIVQNNSCEDVIMLYLKNDTAGCDNAHCALANQTSSYPYVVCCDAETTLGETVSADCSATGAVPFLKLSNQTNSHAQNISVATYSYDACIAVSKYKIEIEYDDGCNANQSCLVSISNYTNAHVGNCSHYTDKICAEATFNNTLPIVTYINLTPLSPNTSETLYCNFTIHDNDPGDVLSANFSWYLNGTLQPSLSGQTETLTNDVMDYVTLHSSNTSHFDNWSCTITPYDSYQYGNSNSSENVTIINTPPTIPTQLLPADGNESLFDREVNFTWTESTDIDNDQITYVINLTNTNVGGFYENTTNLSYVDNTELFTDSETEGTLYFWKIKACDPYDCSDWSPLWNFSIEDVVWIEITVDAIDFGNVTIRETYSTLNESFDPFEFENYGNVKADLYNITGNDLWSMHNLSTRYLQMKANYSGQLPYNETGTKIDWFNVSNGIYNEEIIDQFDYHNYFNISLMDVLIEVPSDEPPGNRSTTLTFYWRQS